MAKKSRFLEFRTALGIYDLRQCSDIIKQELRQVLYSNLGERGIDHEAQQREGEKLHSYIQPCQVHAEMPEVSDIGPQVRSCSPYRFTNLSTSSRVPLSFHAHKKTFPDALFGEMIVSTNKSHSIPFGILPKYYISKEN